VWVINLQDFPGEYDEVAAVFAVHDDARAFAGWWNAEELRRFGRESTATAVVEAVDYYPPGMWREPARLSTVAGGSS
jgi:hypothetical protein